MIELIKNSSLNSDFADMKIETTVSTVNLATLNQLCDPGQTKTFFYPTVTAAQALPAEFAGISYLYITLHKPMDGGGLTTYCDAVGIKNSGAIVCAYGFYGPSDIVWTVK